MACCTKWDRTNVGGVASVEVMTSKAHSGGSNDSPSSVVKTSLSLRRNVVAIKKVSGKLKIPKIRLADPLLSVRQTGQMWHDEIGWTTLRCTPWWKDTLYLGIHHSRATEFLLIYSPSWNLRHRLSSDLTNPFCHFSIPINSWHPHLYTNELHQRIRISPHEMDRNPLYNFLCPKSHLSNSLSLLQIQKLQTWHSHHFSHFISG
jgi:hypothetical protein